jgi:hypothetical protein
MTFEQCQAALAEIRGQQKTAHPVIQVTCSGSTLRGRLVRTDTDRTTSPDQQSPFGMLVLEQPGLILGPLSFIQIANIPTDGLKNAQASEVSKANQPILSGSRS